MPPHFPNVANGGATSTNSTTPPPLPASQPSPSTAGWEFAHLIRRHRDPMPNQRIPFRMLSLKVREFLTYQIGHNTRDEAARTLWVQGRPGEGKTEGCLLACLQAGFDVAVVSPGIFAGEVEGASVQALHRLMTELVRWSIAHQVRTVVIIDDFDLSTANVAEDAGHTINSQLLVQEFMSLADNRHLYRNGDGSNIGFIMTVNDASGMRESLTRPGRSIWHDHVPTTEDKANIAWATLQPITAFERDLVDALVSKFAARQPVAFWKALYFRMRALHGQRLIEHGMPNAREIDAVYGRRMPLMADIAWAAAKDVRNARARNFLTKRAWWRR